jgi:hypothetical protein
MRASGKGRSNIVELLLKREAKVEARTDGGRSALMYAAGGGHRDVCAVLLRAGANANARDVDARTPLMYAAIAGEAEIVEYLLRHGANPTARDAKGDGAASLAKTEELAELLRRAGEQRGEAP